MSLKLKKIGILLKEGHAKAETLSKELVPWLESKGCEILKEQFEKADLLLTLGGDGTLIRGVGLLKGKKVPVLGIRLGELGFLTQVSPDEYQGAILPILEKGAEIEERIKVQATITRKGEAFATLHALNDIVLHTTGTARIANFKVSLNGHYFSTVKADGLIIATPTGSTAYSFAAGGPIIEPSHPMMVLTPICPQTMANRPLVMSDHSKIDVSLEGMNSEVLLTADGQEALPIHKEDQVTIQKSGQKAYFVKLPNVHYFDVLRKKLF